MPQESTNLKLKLYNAITDAKESAIVWFNNIFNYSNSNWVKIDEAYGKINSSYIKDIEASGDKLVITKGDDAKEEIEGAIAKPATKTSLGTVRIGDNISVDTEGSISLKKDGVNGALGYEAAEKMNLVAITIPSTGWSTDDNTSYASYIDIEAVGIKPEDCVALVISPDSNLVAKKCFFSATEAMTDKIRIRVRNVPAEDIQAFYYIIREDILMGFGQTPIGGAILPPATKNELGGIIAGDGLLVTSSGYASLAPASDTQLGGIKLSDDFIINSDGVLSLAQEKYPVGSIFLSTSDVEPAELYGGTWEKIAENRTLMGASAAHLVNTTVEAGLPNITGNVYGDTQFGGGALYWGGSGAIQSSKDTKGNNIAGYQAQGHGESRSILRIDASKSNSIYGKSSTVQPPAYYVYIWHRIG